MDNVNYTKELLVLLNKENPYMLRCITDYIDHIGLKAGVVFTLPIFIIGGIMIQWCIDNLNLAFYLDKHGCGIIEVQYVTEDTAIRKKTIYAKENPITNESSYFAFLKDLIEIAKTPY